MATHSYIEAGIEEIVRVLRGSRVLTRQRLDEALNASDWPDGMFEAALRRAVEQGRVRRLQDGLLEIGSDEWV
ncbi:MAG: hypothetical protein DLM64_13350 [Solirubrobacterales bacterium]|nr:MAG: hypothetical protein DLM63_10050 [Solirubrobacterales bacterium]PZS08022.1 MAG: hypothetical protein DLM64_13350 [Solirubrobacterales bacterium]